MKILSLLIVSLLISGCAGSGFQKKATLMPDQVKLEFDVNPQDDWNSKEVTMGASWNLK